MKKIKVKWVNVILMLIIMVCLMIFVLSSYKVIYRLIEKKNTDSLIKEINSLVVVQKNEIDINEEELNENSEITDNKEEINYYYEYLKVPFMSVEFSKLKQINSDVVGWISVTSAGINYPYVQTSDNDYYLTHAFDKSQNASGWVFLDHRNDKNNYDKNTIIYAHGGNAMAMFGPLKRLYDKPDWFNNSDNHYIKISTDKFNLVYKVFSLYVIKTTSDYLKINFSYDEAFMNFVSIIKERSYYDFETDILENDKIITLSTCYNKKEKLVLHGKLVKQESR